MHCVQILSCWLRNEGTMNENEDLGTQTEWDVRAQFMSSYPSSKLNSTESLPSPSPTQFVRTASGCGNMQGASGEF